MIAVLTTRRVEWAAISIQVVNSFEVIIEIFFAKGTKMLPDVEDQEQHFTNRRQEIFNDNR